MTLIVTLILAGLAAETPAPPRGGKIEWSADLEKGLANANKEKRPVMIYFTADW